MKAHRILLRLNVKLTVVVSYVSGTSDVVSRVPETALPVPPHPVLGKTLEVFSDPCY